MDIKFVVEYTAYFNLQWALSDFYNEFSLNPYQDIDKLIYDVVEDNIGWPMGIDETPNEVVETAANALRKAIGGIQLKMELD